MATATEIVADGLELGGNPGLSALGLDFLNYLLDDLYRRKDWTFLRKRTTAVADSSDYSKIPISALPTTYRAIARLRPQTTLCPGWLKQNPDFDDLYLKLRMDVENSVAAAPVPTEFAVDEGSMVAGTMIPDIYVYPKPDTRFTYDLFYYTKPANLTGGDTPLFPNHRALVYAIAEWCKDYERDTLQAFAVVYADKILAGWTNNAADRGRSDQLAVEFDNNVWKYSRSD